MPRGMARHRENVPEYLAADNSKPRSGSVLVSGVCSDSGVCSLHQVINTLKFTINISNQVGLVLLGEQGNGTRSPATLFTNRSEITVYKTPEG
jgi:hypothetical protein